MIRIHILGAAGSGTTTFGAALASATGATHLDTDDYFWQRTDPPYQQPRPRGLRLSLLASALDRTPSWTLSGSLCGWGDPLIHASDSSSSCTCPPRPVSPGFATANASNPDPRRSLKVAPCTTRIRRSSRGPRLTRRVISRSEARRFTSGGCTSVCQRGNTSPRQCFRPDDLQLGEREVGAKCGGVGRVGECAPDWKA